MTGLGPVPGAYILGTGVSNCAGCVLYSKAVPRLGAFAGVERLTGCFSEEDESSR